MCFSKRKANFFESNNERIIESNKKTPPDLLYEAFRLSVQVQFLYTNMSFRLKKTNSVVLFFLLLFDIIMLY